MGKNKLKRWAEMKTFGNVFELDNQHKGKWNEYFQNDNPIYLELGCGRGEYTVGLARIYPDINFIGVDIKGARLWKGAKTSVDEGLKNTAYIRDQIELIENYFELNEVSGIWITFPDPQPQESREKKRLTSNRLLDKYLQFLKPNSQLHLKTDNTGLYEFTLEILKARKSKIYFNSPVVYETPKGKEEALQIETTYEKIFTEVGETIKYIHFEL
ncbi:MAG: tRNA (guanine-N7-)-methyltransferase [Sphingobacteriales bacterium]|jgi:tRNA (guanine-N7-)-methyltransferase